MLEKSSSTVMYKVVVLGAMGSGMTALTLRFVSGQFVEEFDPTIENFYWKEVDVDGSQTMLEILDTAGAEHVTATRDLYIKECHGVLLVYSITDAQSFINVLTLKCHITKGRLSPAIVLVGNKCDLEEKRKVATLEGEMLAHEWGCPFFETSAKTGCNTEEAFQGIVKEIFQKQREVSTPVQESGHAHAVDGSARVQQVNQTSPCNNRFSCVCF